MAGFDLYLNHMASKGDFLIIDEPEMNAHPEAQIALTELFALLVNRGLNITMTTHSPYIIDHLTNLIEASKLPEDSKIQLEDQFKLKNREAFLDPDNVAMYFFDEEGSVHDVIDRDNLTIDWSTFSQQSDYLSRLYGEILEAGSKSAINKE